MKSLGCLGGKQLGNMSGKRILLVDDDPSVAESIQFILKLDRHAVDFLNNPLEALALLLENAIWC